MTPDPDARPVASPGPSDHDPATAEGPAPRRRAGVLRTLILGAGVVLLLIGGVVGATLLGASGGEPAPAPGRPVTDARPLPGAEGAGPLPETLPQTLIDGFAGAPPVDPASYRGSPLVVNLWATWCAPCVEEMPHFQEVAEELEGEVAFLGVDVQDGPARAEPFVAELGITYDLAADPRQEFTEAIGAFGMPTTLFVDAQGRILHRVTGPLTEPQLRAAIATHLTAS